jgi:hypothetical protein
MARDGVTAVRLRCAALQSEPKEVTSGSRIDIKHLFRAVGEMNRYYCSTVYAYCRTGRKGCEWQALESETSLSELNAEGGDDLLCLSAAHLGVDVAAEVEEVIAN